MKEEASISWQYMYIHNTCSAVPAIIFCILVNTQAQTTTLVPQDEHIVPNTAILVVLVYLVLNRTDVVPLNDNITVSKLVSLVMECLSIVSRPG